MDLQEVTELTGFLKNSGIKIQSVNLNTSRELPTPNFIYNNDNYTRMDYRGWVELKYLESVRYIYIFKSHNTYTLGKYIYFSSKETGRGNFSEVGFTSLANLIKWWLEDLLERRRNIYNEFVQINDEIVSLLGG